MTAGDTEQLADLVARKHDCLRQLHDLARRQFVLIEDEHISDLLVLLAHKQRLLGILQGVDQQLTPFRGQQPEQRVWRSNDIRQRTGELLGLCEQLLAEILECEKTGEARLLARRDETALRVKTAFSGHEAHQAYATDYSVAGGRLDFSTEG